MAFTRNNNVYKWICQFRFKNVPEIFHIILAHCLHSSYFHNSKPCDIRQHMTKLREMEKTKNLSLCFK